MIFILYFLCCSCLLLLACNGDQAAKSDKTANASDSAITEVKTEGTNTSGVSTSPLERDNETKAKSKEANTDKAVTPAAINYTVLAEAYCGCAKNTVSVNDKLAKLMDSGDNAAFEALLPEAEKAFKDAMACCRKAKETQSTAAVDQKKLFKPLKKLCPELPKQLMAKMVTEIK